MRTAILSLRHERDGGRGQHSGLLLQRYLCENATGEEGNPEEKRAILEAAIGAASNAQLGRLYASALARWQQSLPPIAASIELQTAGRLIVGLGSENVLETGITLHHTYGLPLLPGSALKGLAAHYCDQAWGLADKKFKKGDVYHKLLFGTTDDSGCIVFHDGWYVPAPDSAPLRLDVMTPHHPRWLDGSVPPTDFDSPNPVPFLSVAGRFFIAVSWRGPVSDQATSWCNLALACLRDALFDWGIGGKTSSGYGRFDRRSWEGEHARRQQHQEQRTQAAAREAAVAAMDPMERTISEFLAQHPNKAEPREWMKLYTELRKPDGRFMDPTIRKAVAARVKEGMIADKAWKDKGKEGERKRFIQEILGEL